MILYIRLWTINCVFIRCITNSPEHEPQNRIGSDRRKKKPPVPVDPEPPEMTEEKVEGTQDKEKATGKDGKKRISLRDVFQTGEMGLRKIYSTLLKRVKKLQE